MENSFDPSRLHSWTEQRLLATLKQFLHRRPSSLKICFFIDGLDDFVGEEETLLNLIDLLDDIPQVKMCVSSRPEQVFRSRFKGSPQLKLQDLNRRDIRRTANGKLRPKLERYYSQDKLALDRLIRGVWENAQGVYLWLHLMIKDIIRGTRNKDTIQELFTRLESMPEEIEGV